MKIERISENQIRCTLNRGDLQERQLSIKEFAYGTPKARSLFREMMQKASVEVGFDANNIPLMIEAIPLSGEGIMLIITRIEDPEELDTRFARFAPTLEEDAEEALTGPDSSLAYTTGAEDILQALGSLLGTEKEQPQTAAGEVSRCFQFRSLDYIIQAAEVLRPIYHGQNNLFRHPGSGSYYLIVRKSSHSPEEFNKICNILSEYGEKLKNSEGSELYYEEHYDCLIPDQALQSF